MNRRNYQREMDRLLDGLAALGQRPRLLLHSCCAPCTSYVLQYLKEKFRLTLFYYNPNIQPREEFCHRLAELERLAKEMPGCEDVAIISPEYDPKAFFAATKGLEKEPEGGLRCQECFGLRLRAAAKYAKENGFDMFATTLTIGPRKNSDTINAIGERAASEAGIRYLCSDFKRKKGYEISKELARKYELYRQNFCGCVFSQSYAEGGAIGRDGAGQDDMD